MCAAERKREPSFGSGNSERESSFGTKTPIQDDGLFFDNDRQVLALFSALFACITLTILVCLYCLFCFDTTGSIVPEPESKAGGDSVTEMVSRAGEIASMAENELLD